MDRIDARWKENQDSHDYLHAFLNFGIAPKISYCNVARHFSYCFFLKSRWIYVEVSAGMACIFILRLEAF